MKHFAILVLVVLVMCVLGLVALGLYKTQQPAPNTENPAQTESPVSVGDFYSVKPGEVVRLQGYCLGNDDPDQCSEHAVFVACLENESRLLIKATVWPNLWEYQIDVKRLLLVEEIVTTDKVPDNEIAQVLQALLGEGMVDEILKDFEMAATDDPDNTEPPFLDKSKGF